MPSTLFSVVSSWPALGYPSLAVTSCSMLHHPDDYPAPGIRSCCQRSQWPAFTACCEPAPIASIVQNRNATSMPICGISKVITSNRRVTHCQVLQLTTRQLECPLLQVFNCALRGDSQISPIRITSNGAVKSPCFVQQHDGDAILQITDVRIE